MGMTREELIATAKRITDLRAEIARLSDLQKELKRLEASIDTITGVPPSGKSRSGTSIEEKVGQFISGNPERDWDAEEVAKALGTKVPTTRAAFSKLRKAGRIEDTKRGRVRASTKQDVIAPQEENLANKAA